MATHKRADVAGRNEFTAYLPSNTQGVVLRPIGNNGVLVTATDTQRGFGKLDQVPLCLLWVVTIYVSVT